jgi:peptidoglycan hydrolase-like protein with peptidoglycan-binding domain
MAHQGLDTATAPEPAKAKQMLDAVGGRWWNVYIGGPSSAAHDWSPERIREYAHLGIDRFMITYAGQGFGGRLTAAQGEIDARDALGKAKSFGYVGRFPICLDIEMPMFTKHPKETVDYARGWCEAVRRAGARPGVYANPAPLQAMHNGNVEAGFVWIASWVSNVREPHDPHAAKGIPAELWAKRGQRAWQYAGVLGKDRPCQVLGVPVDISVADLGCLAQAPNHKELSVGVARPARVLRQGDHGPVVRRLTRRLSVIRSNRTRLPYLDGARDSFDAETEAALRAFQQEHKVQGDGLYGRRTAQALLRAVRLEKQRVEKQDGTRQPAVAPKRTLRALVDELRRLDAETDRAWKELAEFGARRGQALLQARATALDPGEAELARILRRIEHRLDELVEMEERDAAGPHALQAPAATEIAAAAHAGGAPQAQEAKPQPPTDAQLLARIDELDAAIGHARDRLIGRYARVERELARVAPAKAPPDGQVTTPAKVPVKPVGPAKGPVKPVKPVGPAKRPKLQPSEEVKDLQRRLNKFTERYLENLVPLEVDGKRGPLTRKRIRQAKHYLGYRGPDEKSLIADPLFLRRLDHPKSPRHSNPAMLTRAARRRARQRKVAKASSEVSAGVSMFGTKQVASWLVPYLEYARAHGWQGQVTSGYRSPEYSEHLCYAMCRAPRCPGKCAGRTSNHSGRVMPHGAIDVTDYARFAEIMRQCPLQPRIFNNLPADRVHFSATGN